MYLLYIYPPNGVLSAFILEWGGPYVAQNHKRKTQEETTTRTGNIETCSYYWWTQTRITYISRQRGLPQHTTHNTQHTWVKKTRWYVCTSWWLQLVASYEQLETQQGLLSLVPPCGVWLSLRSHLEKARATVRRRLVASYPSWLLQRHAQEFRQFETKQYNTYRVIFLRFWFPTSLFSFFSGGVYRWLTLKIINLANIKLLSWHHIIRYFVYSPRHLIEAHQPWLIPTVRWLLLLPISASRAPFLFVAVLANAAHSCGMENIVHCHRGTPWFVIQYIHLDAWCRHTTNLSLLYDRCCHRKHFTLP